MIFEKLVFNGDIIPSRNNFFKLLKRNYKNKYCIIDCMKRIFSNVKKNNQNTFNFKNKYSSYKLDNNLEENLNWMEKIESNSNIIIPFLKPNIIKIGNIYVDLEKKFFKLSTELTEKHIEKLSFKGGALLSRKNCGKRKCMSTYSYCNTPINSINPQNFNIKNNIYNKYLLKLNTNLIICNADTIVSWKKELLNISDSLKIIIINTRSTLEKLKYKDIITANYVIINIKLLINNYIYKELCNKYYLDTINIQENILSLTTEQFRKRDFLSHSIFFISQFRWYRIIFDECFNELQLNQEIYSSSIIKSLSSEYRWCICNSSIDFNEVYFINIFTLLISNYKFTHNVNCDKLITNFLFRYYEYNNHYDINNKITWLTFNEYEKKLIMQSKNCELFTKKICNCSQIMNNSEILFEKNLSDISNLLIKNKHNLLVGNIESNNSKKKLKKKFNYTNDYYIDIMEKEICCNICFCTMNKINEYSIPCITQCGHLYCHSCLSETMNFSNKCPKCRQSIDHNSIILIKDNKNYGISNLNLKKIYGTKIDYLFNNYLNKQKKIIVISQFDDILLKISEILNKQNIKPDIIISNTVINPSLKIFQDILLVSSKLNIYPIFKEFYNVIFLDPIYDDKLNIQEKIILNSIINTKNKKLIVNKLFMKESPEEIAYNL